MMTFFAITLSGGLFDAAYSIQTGDYDDALQKFLEHFRILYSSEYRSFERCVVGESLYVFDDNVWTIDPDDMDSYDKFEIIILEQGEIMPILD